eukprot:GHVN01039801.1.p1 GENE.GHVN01039801.1~~GHVN01039801.1.p1  ORF type:complete len:145 (-),score=31.64 GHVN01039801.1:450-884(-)
MLRLLSSFFGLVACLAITADGFRYYGTFGGAAPAAVPYGRYSSSFNPSPSSGRLLRGLSPNSRLSGTVEDVRDVVASQLGVDKEKVVSEASFITDLGADSLDSVELVMALEEKFGVTIPDEDATKIKTVDDAVKYIEALKTKEA